MGRAVSVGRSQSRNQIGIGQKDGGKNMKASSKQRRKEAKPQPKLNRTRLRAVTGLKPRC